MHLEHRGLRVLLTSKDHGKYFQPTSETGSLAGSERWTQSKGGRRGGTARGRGARVKASGVGWEG